MAIINFTVPEILERKIKEVIKKKGFASKAELFRFAVLRYLDETEKLPLDSNPRIAALSREMEREMLQKLGQSPLPAIEVQLKRMRRL